MSEIQQLYCTHCTHGSSALERQSGALAQRMLGYSARAGSLEPVGLRRYYRQIESYVYYYLPRDTSAEAKVTLTADTAPRRLVSLPAAGEVQMLSQVCYRPFDTEGRPGSYFAHVLAADRREAASAWSPCEALRLWRAPGWVAEDSPALSFLLPSLGALEELLEGRRPAVDDAVLRSFLVTAANGTFDDPQRVIPARWRKREPRERQTLLVDVLAALLEIDVERHASLLLVAEPDLAALVFYGVLRLLPDCPWTRAIGFSTFEPNPERLCTALAATHFADPAADLRPEAYRGNVPVINTFTNQRSPRRRSGGVYAGQMVARLLDEGWSGVARALDDFSGAAPLHAADLEMLATLEQTRARGLTAPFPSDWRQHPVARAYLRRFVGRELSTLGPDAAKLKQLAGGPNHLALLELTAEATEFPAARGAAEFLLRNLPDDQLGALLQLEHVAVADKAAAVARTLAARGDVPDGCPTLWDEALAAATAPGGPQPSLLSQALLSLTSKTLETFYQQSLPEQRPALFWALVVASRQKPARRAVLGRLVEQMSIADLTGLLLNHGPALLAHYPEDEPALGLRLQELTRRLPEPLDEFPRLLQLLRSARQRLPDPAEQERLDQWQACLRAIERLGVLQEERRGVLRRRPVAAMEEVGQTLAAAAAAAMSGEAFAEDFSGAQRERFLRQVGMQLLPDRGLLPAGSRFHQALWLKIQWQFKHGSWPRVPWWRMGSQGKSGVSAQLVVGIVAAVVVLAVVVVGFSLLGTQETPVVSPVEPVATPPPPKTVTPPPTTDEQAAAQLEARRRAAAEEEQQRRARAQREQEEQLKLRAAADAQAQADWLAQKEGRPRPTAPAAGTLTTGTLTAGTLTAGTLTAAPPQPQLPPAMPAPQTPPAGEAVAANVGVVLPPAVAPPAAVPPAAAVKDPPPPANDPFAAWRARMRELAQRSRGIFLERIPMVNGVAAPEVLENLPMQGLALGAGRLEGGAGTYEFGEQFQQEAFVTRQGAPRLAAEMGLAAVTVALRRQGESGTRIVIEIKPKLLPTEAGAPIHSQIDTLTKRRNVLKGQLQGKPANEEALAAWNKGVLELLGLKLPQLPEEPRFEGSGGRDDEKRQKAIDTYRIQLQTAQRQRAELLGQLRDLAQQELSRLNGQLKQLQDQVKAQQTEVARQNEQARSRVLQRCEQLSAIVYRVRGNLDVADVAPQPPAAEPAAAAEFGRFSVTQQEVQDLPEGVQARLRLRVVDPAGEALPPDRGAAGAFVADCMVYLQPPQGEPRMKRSGGVANFEAVNIGEEYRSVEFMFVFYQNLATAAPKSVEICHSRRMALPPLKPKQEYEVTLQLNAAELERLNGTAGGRRTKTF